jgi:surface antigen
MMHLKTGIKNFRNQSQYILSLAPTRVTWKQQTNVHSCSFLPGHTLHSATQYIPIYTHVFVQVKGHKKLHACACTVDVGTHNVALQSGFLVQADGGGKYTCSSLVSLLVCLSV